MTGVSRDPRQDGSDDPAIGALLRDVLDSFHEGCQVIGFDWRYRYLNDTAAAQGKRRKEELLGRTMMECYPGIDATPMFALLRRSMLERTDERMENEFTYPDGGTAWFELRFVPVPEGVFVLSLDITEQKRADAERRRLEAQLAQQQRLETIGRLAGGVAHDFNNLLTVIISYADSVLDQLPADGQERADVQEIRRAGRRAAVLVGQLLAFSRQQVLQPRVVNLNGVVTGAEGMLRRVIREDITLSFVLDPALGNVKADPGQLEQVLMNLVVNARDAMPSGGRLTIETREVELDAEYASRHAQVVPGAYACLAVSDTGVGMSDETQARVFEPFFSTKETGAGTGLGLATVYGIVRQSGGHIWVYSEPGQGTTFKLYFPIEPSGVEQARRTPVPTAHQGAGETILIVEDEPALLAIARRLLADSGFRILASSHGEEALRVAAEHGKPIDLLLTDLVMPKMNGRSLAAALRATHRGLRVLYMSGYSDDAVLHHGAMEPGASFISKPFSRAELVAKVRAALGD